MIDRQIVLNSIKCLECGETLISHYQHDYRTCSCDNNTMCDGGVSYLRYGAKDMSKVKLFTVYADDDFELVRLSAERGGRGVDGTEPLTWTKVADMNDDWLEAVLEYGGADWHLDIIRKEIEYRGVNNIKVA